MPFSLRSTFPLILSCLGVLSVQAAFAHHGVTAHFNLQQPVVLDGEIDRVVMRNPHATMFVNVPDANGNPVTWECEMHGSTILGRLGVTREMLSQGKGIRIEGFQHRRNEHGCYFDVAMLETGERIELGFLTGEQPARMGEDSQEGTIFGSWTRKDFAVAQTVRRNFEVPLTERGLAAHQAYDPIRDDPTLHCSPVSQNRVWGMATQPTAISREGEDILIRHEWMDVRRPIDLPPYDDTPKAPVDLGHSRAVWEGDALVITTTGFTAGVLTQFVENFAGMASTGVLHSDEMVYTEVLTIDEDTDELLIEWTVNDPAYFTETFSGSHRLVRSDLEIQPYNCTPDV